MRTTDRNERPRPVGWNRISTESSVRPLFFCPADTSRADRIGRFSARPRMRIVLFPDWVRRIFLSLPNPRIKVRIPGKKWVRVRNEIPLHARHGWLICIERHVCAVTRTYYIDDLATRVYWALILTRDRPRGTPKARPVFRSPKLSNCRLVIGVY